jgi:predicted DNA-binding antitoxin AbrB/MazE fold protein
MAAEDTIMSTHVEAVYENGVFRPLQPVQLPEHQRVTVTIDDQSAGHDAAAHQAHFVLPAERWQAFCDALDAPPKVLPRLKILLTEASPFDGNGPGAP